MVRTAAQIRTDHWRSTAFPKRIKKHSDVRCWFCQVPKMTRSHVILHCTRAKLRAAPGGGMGGQGPSEHSCASQQCQMETAPTTLSGTVGRWKSSSGWDGRRRSPSLRARWVDCMGSGGGGRAGAHNLTSSPFSYLIFHVKGDPYASSAHSVRWGRRISFLFPLLWSRLVSFVLAGMYGGPTYPLGMKDLIKKAPNYGGPRLEIIISRVLAKPAIETFPLRRCGPQMGKKIP